LCFRPLVIEAVHANVLHQDVQAVNESAGGGPSGTTFIGGENKELLRLEYCEAVSRA
jgi:hypothetical protein